LTNSNQNQLIDYFHSGLHDALCQSPSSEVFVYRIVTTDSSQKWEWACPHPDRHRNWRVTNGLFECRQCKKTYTHLVRLKTGERVPREQIELVGPESDHQGQFGRPTVE